MKMMHQQEECLRIRESLNKICVTGLWSVPFKKLQSRDFTRSGENASSWVHVAPTGMTGFEKETVTAKIILPAKLCLE
jgi:hypothetical protein